MKIIHRLSFNAREGEVETNALKNLDIKYKFIDLPAPKHVNNPVGMVAFEINESDTRWDSLRKICDSWNCLDIVRTEFAESDYSRAAYSQIMSDWNHGYPMPDDDSGYQAITYEEGSICGICGVGGVQKSSFRMKGEPIWGQRGVLQLHWIFDELFVKPEVYTEVFEPFRIECRPVVRHNSGAVLSSVLQLDIHAVATSKLDIQRPYDETCARCGHGKYFPHTRGYFPSLLAKTDMHLFRTQEYFGSGGSASRAIVASRELQQSIRRFGVTGVKTAPLAHRR